MLFRQLFFPLFIILLLAVSARGQMVGGEVGADSISNALVPAFGYSSNEGFVGGAVYNRYDYRGDIKPFNNYLESSALVSTKGFVEVAAEYEQSRSFDRRLRSIVDFFFYRYTTDVFFGLGNEVPFSDNLWNDEYYFYESVSFGLDYKLRKPLFADSERQLDLQVGLSTKYFIPYVTNQQSSFAQNSPNGKGGGWINSLSSGLIWENRDSEFDPSHGNRAELEIRFTPDLISSYPLTTARIELRQYFQLFNWLTVANRLEARHAQGDVPYWEMSTLGSSYTLRGYPLNRFRGNSSMAYTLELRGWILEFPDMQNLKFGGHLFTDAGRVFTKQDDINDLFEGYKQTVGFGGAMSVFNPDFILRGEIGFSEDVSRIYIGVGYLF